MKLCLYQGTFNPIHNAHLHVAEYAINSLDIDKVLFIPAAIPPHKSYDDNISIDRLNMVKLAVEGYKDFEVSDIEYKLKGKSYTYRTVCELYKIYNDIDGKIKFLIGTDAFEKIESWYESDKLKELVDFIVFIRENDFDENRFKYLEARGYKFQFMPLEFLDISSTEIREKVKNNADITNLVPEKVKEYIYKNELYKD